jgi:nondiscriminating glutamyl-tRNA synthetase
MPAKETNAQPLHTLNTPSQDVRVRIAPSPTGSLHLGTARTALYNYLYAKRFKGKFVMRLEDTDEERSEERFTEDIIAGMKWLGLNWDEGPDIGGPYPPYRQTLKEEHYSNVANKLIAKGAAYFAYETPEELAAMKEEQKEKGQPPRYDNRGRHLSKSNIEHFTKEGRVPSVRFIVEEPRTVMWQDQIRGQMAIESTDLGGDIVIVKSSGIATYNFAVVVDDIDMKMSHVIRGEDHIHNTAKQLLIYEALNIKPPQFAHAALIFDNDHRKLSKRVHGEKVHIDYYRQQGYLPEAIVNYLAQMSFTPADGREIFTLEEGSEMFELARMSKSPAVFDLQRLNWFNGHYIRSLPIETITARCLPYLTAVDTAKYTDKQMQEIIISVRDGLSILAEVLAATRFYFVDKPEISDETKKSVFTNPQAKTVLTRTMQELGKLPFGDHKGCKHIIDTIGKELGVKGKELYWPLRAALAGTTQGPDLGSIISILGAERIKTRIEAALACCS